MAALMVASLTYGQENDVDNVGGIIRSVFKKDLAFCDLMVFTTEAYSQDFFDICRLVTNKQKKCK